VYKSCPDAEIDGMIRHSGPNVPRCLYFKRRADSKHSSVTLDYDLTRKVTGADTKAGKLRKLGPNSKLVRVCVSYLDQSGNRAAVLEDHDVVVTRAEGHGFFGRTFADRFALMVDEKGESNK